jgi:hypothetical protein
MLSTYVLPHLPAHLYRLAYPRIPPLPIIDMPSLTGTDSNNSSGTGTSGTGTTASSGASTVSGLTSVGGSSRGGGGNTNQSGRTKGTFQVNLNPDPTLHRLAGPSVKLRDLIGTDPPPMLDSGEQICLPYYSISSRVKCY